MDNNKKAKYKVEFFDEQRNHVWLHEVKVKAFEEQEEDEKEVPDEHLKSWRAGMREARASMNRTLSDSDTSSTVFTTS